MKNFASFTYVFAFILFYSTISSIGFGQNHPGNDHRIYQVYVGTIGQGEELSGFEDLREFGFISLYSLAHPPKAQSEVTGNARKVFLGPYLGEEAANKVLELVLSKGYGDAYIDADESTLTASKGKNLIYSVQIGAFANPNMRKFAGIANTLAYGIFMTYEGGLFKVLSGMYEADNADYVRSEVLPYLKSRGYNGFLRTFRQPYGG